MEKHLMVHKGRNEKGDRKLNGIDHQAEDEEQAAASWAEN
jgi:hypothetical protein